MRDLVEYAVLFVSMLLVVVGFIWTVRAVFIESRRGIAKGLGCIAVGLLVAMLQSRTHYWRVDRCLDHDGRYNYETKTCES
jgi:hypothetical protein